MPIRWKLLLLSLGPAALAAGLLMAYSLWSFQGFFVETTRADLQARALVLADSVADALTNGHPEYTDVLTRRSAAGSGVRARVITPGGNLLASSDPELDSRLADWSAVPGVSEALVGGEATGVGQGVFGDGERLFVAQPIRREGRLLGAVRISMSLQQFNRQLSRNLRGALLALVAVLLGSAALGALLARSISEPIHAMSRLAARVGSGHLGETLRVRSSDELGQLAAELNRMSAQLAAVDETRRMLLANVTHEFLTPVTNVQVTLEALQAGAAADGDLRERFLQNAYDEMERLKHLLQDLLDLGRLEAGIAPLRLSNCSVRALLDRCIRAVESRLEARGLTAVVSGPDVTVNADPERLQQGILAVLDNAIKHSPPGGVLALRIESDTSDVRLSICDQGPGISSADLPHLFEPFYVGDASRSGNSTGLGLAIAQRIAVAHGGTLRATAEPGNGAVFELVLPQPLPQIG